MALPRIALLTLVFLGIAMPKTLATEYVVGDQKGWTLGFDYQAWADSKEFRVGDKLIFKYAKGAHNVVIMDSNSFKFCEPKSGDPVFESGYDVLQLGKGSNLYICSIGHHCQAGMKMSINVSA